MPARASSRSTRSSGATTTRKASTTKSRTSSTRTSSHAVEIPNEGEATTLRDRICQIFADAQKTTATQRKLVVSLRKIQEECCYEPQNPKKKQVEEFDESDFNEEITRCILRIMTVKKSEPIGDRIIRFLGVFLKYATEKDNAIMQPDDAEQTVFPETPSSRLTAHVLSTVLSLVDVKDKTVRFRSTQTVAHIVNSLDQIDDELFDQIRLKLAKRLRDKEHVVRVQAVLGLGRLADNDDEDNEDSDDDNATGGILAKLLDIMQNDPSAEVRRAVLMNLPFHATTLRWLLERARDSDPATRRALYGKLLPALGDFRHMSLVEREKLIRWGLRDRDETVRKATARLFRERWIEDCTELPDSQDEKKPGEVSPPDMNALTELLERINVTWSGAEEGMAHQAMREFWDGRPDYRDYVAFDDDFWRDLSSESAFIARSFNDYCLSTQDEQLRDEKIPEVARLAYFIQERLNALVPLEREVAIRENDDPEYQELAERVEEEEFIMEQLLHIALTLDYSDEVGRRMIFNLMRNAIANAALPEECTKLALEVLRAVCGSRDAGEREYCSVILEAIADIRDTLMPDEATEVGDNAEDSFHSAQSDVTETADGPSRKKKAQKEEDPEAQEERQLQEALVFMKCLHIAQCMLQNIHGGLEDNSSLVTTLNNLIVPAVRSHDENIRERGVVCLGLACLLSKNLASSNMELFLHCYSIGPESLKIIVIQVLTDVIITHPELIAPVPAEPDSSNAEEEEDAEPQPNPWLKYIVKAFMKAFSSDKPSLSLEAGVAGSKLLLLNVLPPDAITTFLKAFTLAYFNPDTASNPALRQSLSYFLPVFCHSRQKNALLMSQIAIPVIQKLMVMREDIDEEDDEMVGWPVVAAHLAEWTDGRKVVGASELGIDGKVNTPEGAEEAHIQLAVEILERALRDGCTRDERKALLSLLTKLHVGTAPSSRNEDVYKDALGDLHTLVTEAVEGKLGPDATSRNFLVKLESGLTKRLGGAQGQDAGEEEAGEGEDTVVPVERSKGSVEVEAEAEAEVEVEDDTMLAEGTRMPLEEEEDEEMDVDQTEMSSSTAVGGARKSFAVTEDDIMADLLESEMSM
ncbi:condensin complex component cnd3 [Dendryphion nanum]|uniref:Condensin complex component cnd3 n=1 Tax=Dendryphion nanum TaxID=256645 RepID=A0A9P9IY28_9PLEO|nr:condensin complex component cnd3 [Dendryphion nanum]